MSKALMARVARLEGALRGRSQPFDYRAAYGVDRTKFEQAMGLIHAARTHSVCTRTPSPVYSHAIVLSFEPAPYEPECPADWSDSERAAWPGLVELYDFPYPSI